MTTSSADPSDLSPAPGADRAITGRTLHAGCARGRVLHLDEPLSFWGGTDHTGRIIDQHHPQCGESVAGAVLVMSSGRGSSSSSYVLAEQLRVGAGPAAIVMSEADAIVTLGAIVADELYGHAAPVVMIDAAELAALTTGDEVTIDAGPRSAVIARLPVRDADPQS
jgi:predicted aconitase with swiveling domain